MSLWDSVLVVYAGLGRHAPAIVFEFLLVASFIALRLFSGATRALRKTADVDVANLAVEPTK